MIIPHIASYNHLIGEIKERALSQKDLLFSQKELLLKKLTSFNFQAQREVSFIVQAVKPSISCILDIKQRHLDIKNNADLSVGENEKITDLEEYDDSERKQEKINGIYLYKNINGRSFEVTIEDDIVYVINPIDDKEYSSQQKSAIQKSINNKELFRFKKIVKFSELRKIPIKNDLQVKRKPDKKQAVETPDLACEQTSEYVEFLLNNSLSEEEITKRDKDLIGIYKQFEGKEIILFFKDNKGNEKLIIAKKLIKLFLDYIPKSTNTTNDIKVNNNLLDKVTACIKTYLEKTGFESKEAEICREHLMQMLNQAKYILEKKINGIK